MSRQSYFSSPLLLGFDEIERLLDRVNKTAHDGYPPYNIEQIGSDRLRITLAVAGFDRDGLQVTVEDSQLVIRGKQGEDPEKVYLHRGIATRQFQRAFVLAEGIEVVGAGLDNGLLTIELKRLKPETIVRNVEIKAAAKSGERQVAKGEKVAADVLTLAGRRQAE